jgi:hypothetical protein
MVPISTRNEDWSKKALIRLLEQPTYNQESANK